MPSGRRLPYGLGIRTGLGGPGFQWSSYWTTHLYNEADLALKFDSRSGNILTDSVSGETATILVEELKSNGTKYAYGDKTRAVEHLFDGNDHTIYFRFIQHTDVPGTGTQSIVKLGGSSTAHRAIYVKFNNNTCRLDMMDAAGHTFEVNCVPLANTNVRALAYVDLVITIDGTGKVLVATFYKPDGTVLGTQKTQSLATFTFNTNDNTGPYTFDSAYAILTNFKKFTGIKTLANCRDNSYTTGLALHYPHIIGLMNAVEDANHLIVAGAPLNATVIDYISCNSYALDYGWDNYQQGLIDFDNTQWNRYCCRKVNGDQIKPAVTAVGCPHAAFRVVGERAGGTLYNLFPAKIRFTNAFFDRSNATIWNDACRAASDYDATNTKDFKTVNLNQRTLQSWLNAGYRGRLYMHFTDNSIERLDRQYCRGIYLYNTDNKGIDQAKVHQYTGDYIAWVLSGTQRTLDAEGYTKLGTLKTTKAMISVVIDDGYLDAFTGWRPYFATNGFSPLSGLHSDQVGEVIDGNDSMTWAQIQTLYSEGWLFANHNTIDSVTDYSDVSLQATLEALLTEGKADIEAQGIDCKWYVGNRHSSNNAAIEYFTHKLGYRGHFTWNVYGEGGVVGANPLAINLFRIRRLSTDEPLPVGWDLDKADAAAEIANTCAEIDTAISEKRWIVLMLHNPSANLYANLQTVIDYADLQGIEKVSVDEAFANCKYL